MPFRRSNEPDRVRRYTSEQQLRRINEMTLRNVRHYSGLPPDVIETRIQELEGEWSVERFLQLNVATIGLTTALLAATRNRKWGYATCAALAFFLLHATDGFDPPLPLLRQLGVRTRSEIDREIYALKVIRGDFDDVRETRRTAEPAAVGAALRAVGIGENRMKGYQS